MTVTWDHREVRPGFWNVTFLNVKGGYELTGPHPVQAVGSIAGVDFYFRAKSGHWEFETNDERGWLFPIDDKRGFQRRGRCLDGDTMPYQKAAEIIAACATELLSQITGH